MEGAGVRSDAVLLCKTAAALLLRTQGESPWSLSQDLREDVHGELHVPFSSIDARYSNSEAELGRNNPAYKTGTTGGKCPLFHETLGHFVEITKDGIEGTSGTNIRTVESSQRCMYMILSTITHLPKSGTSFTKLLK